MKDIKEVIRSHQNAESAAHAQRFFKTGPGQYGEGDIFLGIRVPVLRKIARTYKTLSLETVLNLLQSKFHEERLVALYILVDQFSNGDSVCKEQIFNGYLANTRYINNWDLVDTSAHKIVGPFLENKDRSILYDLATSTSLWERRISILSTFHFIYLRDFDDTFNIADILLRDKHDLIHKAVGWMLREVGNRDQTAEESFLESRYQTMPRTMLRYAIEKFDEDLRQRYLKGLI